MSLATGIGLSDADRSWVEGAACLNTDPKLFFPPGEGSQYAQQIKTAKEVCRQCNVQVECLNYALITNQDDGIWGGTLESERRKLRRAWVARQRQAG